MATSQGSRHINKALTILREYLNIQKSSSKLIDKITPPSTSDRSAEAALQAINKYVHNLGGSLELQETSVNFHNDKKEGEVPNATTSNAENPSIKQPAKIEVRSSSVPPSVGRSPRQLNVPPIQSYSRHQSPNRNSIQTDSIDDNASKPKLPTPPLKYSVIKISSSKPVKPPILQSSTVSTAPIIPEENKGSDLQKALKTVNSYIPSSLSQVNLNFLRYNGQNAEKPVEKAEDNLKPSWLEKKKEAVSKYSVDGRTRHLIRGILLDNEGATLRRLKDLTVHLRAYPQTKGTAVKSGGLGRLLRVIAHSDNEGVVHEAKEALALMGYSGPVSGRGPRILTIDGGGVRGLVAIELIRKLEEKTGKKVHEMFDLICGVSTGAIVAVMVGSHRYSPDECSQLYRNLSERIFTQTTLKGATGLFINSSYYDSNEWNTILKQNMGDVPLMESAYPELSSKICLVASQAVRSETHAFLFRNYVLPYRVASHYEGTSRAMLWEAVRASAAAPGYFSEYKLGDKILQDGGILVNNPTAIAVHEARQLWPDLPFQCVVSLGTGRCQPIEKDDKGGSLNWTVKLRSVLNSATDTEGIHTVLHDLLPGNVYFRFNPNLNDDYSLDEIRPDRLASMMDDTKLYIRRNDEKFMEAANALLKEKTVYHKATDYIKKAQIQSGWKL